MPHPKLNQIQMPNKTKLINKNTHLTQKCTNFACKESNLLNLPPPPPPPKKKKLTKKKQTERERRKIKRNVGQTIPERPISEILNG
jgi:hypothetical protein